MKKVIILRKIQKTMNTFAPPFLNYFSLNLNIKKTCGNDNHEKQITDAIVPRHSSKFFNIQQKFFKILYTVKVFSCEIRKIYKNTFSYRTPPVATSETKHMLQLPFFTYQNRKFRTGANADIAKTKREKWIQRWMQL